MNYSYGETKPAENRKPLDVDRVYLSKTYGDNPENYLTKAEAAESHACDLWNLAQFAKVAREFPEVAKKANREAEKLGKMIQKNAGKDGTDGREALRLFKEWEAGNRSARPYDNRSDYQPEANPVKITWNPCDPSLKARYAVKETTAPVVEDSPAVKAYDARLKAEKEERDAKETAQREAYESQRAAYAAIEKETAREIEESNRRVFEAASREDARRAEEAAALSARVQAEIDAGNLRAPKRETDEERSRREFEERQAAMPAKEAQIRAAHPEMDATDVNLKARADLRKAQKAARTRKATAEHKAYLASKAAAQVEPHPAKVEPEAPAAAKEEGKPKEGEEVVKVDPFLQAVRMALESGSLVERTSAAYWVYASPTDRELHAALKAARFFFTSKRSAWYKPAPAPEIKRHEIKSLEEATA